MSEKPINQDPLRTAAETKLARIHAPKQKPRPAEELLHELQLHQIELEMQNEQLRQSQIELEKARDRYMDFYDFAPVGYLTLSHEGMIDEINLTGAALLGVERNKLPYHRFASYVATEDRDRWHRHFMYALKDDKSLSCELALQHDNEPLLYAQLNCLRLKNDGKDFVVRVVLTDIAEHRNKETTLLEAQERLQKIASQVPGAIYQFRLRPDGSACMPYVSDAFNNLFRLNPAEVREDATKAFMRAHPDDLKNFMASIQASARDLTPWQHEYRLKFDDGTVRWLFGNSIPQREADGATLWHGFITDITENKKSEQALIESLHKLEEKELSKSRFFAAAGHDLRQPLAAANLFLDALKVAEPTPKQDKIIQRLDQAMSTFSGLLNSLLNISKLDSGVIKPEPTPINVTEVFNLLEQSFAPMASEKQLGFKLHFPMKETLVVFSDIGLLNSVLTNIVSNAIKFTSKGAILISARKRGREVLFQIWDTGIGITDEHIEHIFDEFYQVGNPQRDRTAGLGLGLAIAKRAITLLGSKITCRSQIGRGSVFEFCLPLDGVLKRQKQQAAIEALQEDETNLLFVQGKRFVVVEDDLLVAQALTQSLEGLGGEVECFHSAEDALRHSNIEYADCYIVDYMLGGKLNGIQFLNMLRQKFDKPIKAVLVTGDTSSTFIRDATNFDWPVLHKPVNTAKLISALL